MEDTEGAFYKELAKIRSLKNRVGRLSARVEKLEILDIQNQINTLSDETHSLQNTVIETQRLLASLHIDVLRTNLLLWLAINYDSKHPIHREVREYILPVASAAQQEVVHVSAPISIAQNFRNQCHDYFEQHGLDAFLQI